MNNGLYIGLLIGNFVAAITLGLIHGNRKIGDLALRGIIQGVLACFLVWALVASGTIKP